MECQREFSPDVNTLVRDVIRYALRQSARCSDTGSMSEFLRLADPDETPVCVAVDNASSALVAGGASVTVGRHGVLADPGPGQHRGSVAHS